MQLRMGSIAKKVGYVIAGIVILAALLVVASRLLTPYLDARRPLIESWASELLQTPVKIEKARVSWFQYQPGVSLHSVTMLDAKTNEPLLQVDKVKVYFSIPQSLWQWKLVPGGIVISGANLVVHQSPSGEFSVQGFPSLGGFDQQPFKEESKIPDVVAWLSLQPRMILRDIDIRYTDRLGVKRYVTVNDLRFINSSAAHYVYGQAILHQEFVTEVELAARWAGDMNNLSSLHGKVYLNLSGLSLLQWFNHTAYKGWEIKKGMLSAKIWGTWRNNNFQQIQTTFQVLNLDLYSATDKTMKRINRLSGDIGWKREGDNQIIAGDDILIDGAEHLWPVTSFYLKIKPDANPLMLNIGYLNIADVRDMLAASPADVVPADILKSMADMHLTGALESLSATFGDTVNPLLPHGFEVLLSGISFQSWHQLPAVKNLRGKVIWKDNSGNLNFLSEDTELRYDTVFDAPLHFDQMTGNVNFQREETGDWKLLFKNLGVLNRDIALTLNGDMNLPATLKPSANLSANFTLRQAAHVSSYLPTKIFSKDLSEWLRNAFLAGNVESGSLILRGLLSDFPFDKNNGDFIITGALNNVRLHYAPAWPDLTNINGSIKFAGRQILIDVDKAAIDDIDIGKTHGEISNIGSDKPSILTVTTVPIQTDFSHGMKFLHDSPLEKTIGKLFHNMAPSGPINISLGLTIPLEDTDATKVVGAIVMKNANFKLIPWKLDISELTGTINFTENSTTANAMSATLFNKPLRLDLETKQSIVVATVTNNIDLQDVETWLKLPASTVAKGGADVVTKINLALDKPIQIHLESGLKGIELVLPEKYGKQADEVRLLSADMTLSEGEPLKIKIDYAELLNAALILTRKDNQFNLQAANIRLGEGSAAWPEDKGLYITGTLKSLGDEEVNHYLAISDSQNKSNLLLRKIDVMVGQLSVYGIQLSKVRLQLTPAKTTWNIVITSDEIAGNITVPVNFSAGSTLIADLDRINLDAISQGKPTSNKIVAKNLPSIQFSADRLTYGGANLGSVSFTTRSSTNGLTINDLNLQTPAMRLQASGDWVQTGKGNLTRLHGKASTKSVSMVLNDLDVDAHNFVASNGDLDFDLSWSAAPYALSLDSMNGKASLNIGKGRIVEIDSATNAKMDLGKMLNLFSLQSIPRRLSFDFSDVFQKGYTFDSLRGDFNFNRGSAITNNMRFDSAVARVEIRGRIGISQKDFDLVLSVTPYVTSSIPIAATLLTGQPAIGIAAWAVNKVIGGAVSQVVTYLYSVTGSWGHPQWNIIHKAPASRT